MNQVRPNDNGTMELVNQSNFNLGLYDNRVSRRIQYGVAEESKETTTSAYRPEDHYLD